MSQKQQRVVASYWVYTYESRTLWILEMSNLIKPLLSIPAPQCVAWHSEDKPFAVGYPSGKILLATTETYENEQPVVLSVFQVCLREGGPFAAVILVAVCLTAREFSGRLLWSRSLYSAGQHEFIKMGPHRTPAALHGQVRSSEDTGTHWRHLGDPPLPHAHEHR